MAHQLLRLRDVMSRTGLARSTIYKRIQERAFPGPVPLGTPRSVGWVAEEVDAWIAETIRAGRRDSAGASSAA